MAKRGLAKGTPDFDFGSLRDKPSDFGFLGVQPAIDINVISRLFRACWRGICFWQR